MFKLFVTTIKCSHVGAGVSVATTVLDFDTAVAANRAAEILSNPVLLNSLKIERKIERLY